MRATFVVASLVSLAFAAPAAAADQPICHGQFAPRTAAERQQAEIEGYMEQRAEFGFRADEAYVRELIRRGVWEYDVGYIPVTPEENDYLRLRDKLELGRKAARYLKRRPDLDGGLSVEDDWPRGPYLLQRLTRDRAAHEYNLRKLVRYPDNFRTREVLFSYHQLRQVQNRIDRDWEALGREGFDLSSTSPDIDTNTVEVELITKRADATAYFRGRYGPVTVTVIASEPTYLGCEEASSYGIAGDGRRLTIHWGRSSSVTFARIDVVEHADRVEIGVIDRVPHGGIHADLVGDQRRVRLQQPLGDRLVIDMADGRPLPQTGPSPGDPPCPKRKKWTRLDEEISIRAEFGLPHGRAYVRRMQRRTPPYTQAELDYLKLRDTLDGVEKINRYERRHARESGGSSIEDHFPGKPLLVARYTRRLAFHARNLRRLMKHPELLRVVRATWTETELEKLATRIENDAEAGDGFIGGFGHAGFLLWNSYEGGGRVNVKVITKRRDARRYFRERYGPAVKVTVTGRRYECGGEFL